MAGAPLTAGTVISKTPKSFLVIVCDCLLHPSALAEVSTGAREQSGGGGTTD